MNKNLIEKIAPQLTELMIKKMETLTEEWRKPWIADLAHGLPRNLRGTPYRGGNILMLLFLSEIAGYSTPLFMTLSRPEKGLQKRVNLMQQTTNSDLSRHYLPRQLRHLILQEYLSGVKTARQLSEEHGIPMSTIHKMGQRWKAKNSCSFVSTPNPYPIMSRVTSEEASELLSENKALRRRLEEALLRLEGYEIMGDILQEEYGIDLLKKSAAGQSSVSKKDTQQ